MQISVCFYACSFNSCNTLLVISLAFEMSYHITQFDLRLLDSTVLPASAWYCGHTPPNRTGCLFDWLSSLASFSPSFSSFFFDTSFFPLFPPVSSPVFLPSLWLTLYWRFIFHSSLSPSGISLQFDSKREKLVWVVLSFQISSLEFWDTPCSVESISSMNLMLILTLPHCCVHWVKWY